MLKVVKRRGAACARCTQMAAASWPTGKLSLALAAVAIAWSFPVRAFAQALSPEAQTATNPINHAAESSGAQPSTLTGDWGGFNNSQQ